MKVLLSSVFLASAVAKPHHGHHISAPRKVYDASYDLKNWQSFQNHLRVKLGSNEGDAQALDESFGAGAAREIKIFTNCDLNKTIPIDELFPKFKHQLTYCPFLLDVISSAEFQNEMNIRVSWKGADGGSDRTKKYSREMFASLKSTKNNLRGKNNEKVRNHVNLGSYDILLLELGQKIVPDDIQSMVDDVERNHPKTSVILIEPMDPASIWHPQLLSKSSVVGMFKHMVWKDFGITCPLKTDDRHKELAFVMSSSHNKHVNKAISTIDDANHLLETTCLKCDSEHGAVDGKMIQAFRNVVESRPSHPECRDYEHYPSSWTSKIHLQPLHNTIIRGGPMQKMLKSQQIQWIPIENRKYDVIFLGQSSSYRLPWMSAHREAATKALKYSLKKKLKQLLFDFCVLRPRRFKFRFFDDTKLKMSTILAVQSSFSFKKQRYQRASSRP